MKTFSGKQRHYSYRVLTFQNSAKQQRFIGRHIDRKESTRKEVESNSLVSGAVVSDGAI